MMDAAFEPRGYDSGGIIGHGFAMYVEAGVDDRAGAGEGFDAG